jgi:hypothetical protein
MATAIEDAKRFLFLHPWSTTDVDNPIELLEGVVQQFDDDLEEAIRNGTCEEDEEDEEDEIDDRIDKLAAFIKKLRDERKISEAEYQAACAIK